MKIKVTLEVELDGNMIDASDEVQKLWIENEIIVADSTLKLYSESIGDVIGDVTKVSRINYLT